MMEQFGINLQRNVLYEEFYDNTREIEKLTKNNATNTEIVDVTQRTGD
tara:strand:+ start:321 stop:464 length:144 start_codon:yes stop_codon:yes gene_type:complete